MTAGPIWPGRIPAAYQPAVFHWLGDCSVPFASRLSDCKAVLTPIDGTTSRTGTLTVAEPVDGDAAGDTPGIGVTLGADGGAAATDVGAVTDSFALIAAGWGASVALTAK